MELYDKLIFYQWIKVTRHLKMVPFHLNAKEGRPPPSLKRHRDHSWRPVFSLAFFHQTPTSQDVAASCYVPPKTAWRLSGTNRSAISKQWWNCWEVTSWGVTWSRSWKEGLKNDDDQVADFFRWYSICEYPETTQLKCETTPQTDRIS